MNQEVCDTAETLSACFKDIPVTLTVLKRANAYNVRTRQGRCIWADDLPAGGYRNLLRAMSLFISASQRSDFMEMFSAESLSRKETTLLAMADLFPSRYLSFEGRAVDGNIILSVNDAS